MDFLRAWDRLFAIGALYSHTNHRFVAECEAMFAEWDRTLGPRATFCLEVGRDACALQSHRLGDERGTDRKLIQVMRALGIARLEIVRTIPLEDLHGIISFFIRLKNEVEVTSSFQQYEFSDMPQAVLAKQWHVNDQSLAESQRLTRLELVSEAVEKSLRVLDGESQTPEERRALESRLNHLFSELSERYDLQLEADAASDEQIRDSLADILKLGIQAVQHGLEENSRRADYEKILSAALGLEELAGNTVAQTMISELFRDNMEIDADDDEDVAVVDHADFEHSIDELLEELERNEGSTECRFELQAEDNAEQLAILMQLLFQTDPSDEFDAASAQIQELLSQKLSLRESQVLVSALSECLDRDDLARVDLVLPGILKGLSRDNGELLVKVYQELCHGASERELEAIWPYLVDEILRERLQADPKARKQLCRFVSGLSPEGMIRALERLETLPALRDDAWSRQLFAPLVPELFPVCAALLSSSHGDRMGVRVFKSFQKRPPEGVSPILLEVLGTYSAHSRDLFCNALRAGRDPEAREALRRKSINVLRTALEGLLTRERRFPWVLNAITSLGRLGGDEPSTILERICSERKFGILPVWPRRCRKAARAALNR